MQSKKAQEPSPKPRPPRRAVHRRWCIPPALLHEPDEILEGSHVLAEMRGSLGLLLWQSLRDVTLWAGAPAREREGLFTSEAAQRRVSDLMASDAGPGLEVSLTTLAALVAAPASANAATISRTCLQVSIWAEARGANATAMSYAQAAALACPEEPGPALAAGSLALRWDRSARAETWLRRCIALARRGRDWRPYSEAYVGLGEIYARRGAADVANRLFVQGMLAARRHGFLRIRGAAMHGLMRLSLDTGALDEAERFGRAALRAYVRTDGPASDVEHDLAYVWVRREQYARAIPRLQRLLPSRTDSVERGLTLAILAHAAAGAGDQALYRDYWADAWTVISRDPRLEEKHARALLELVRAAVLSRDWTRVEQAVPIATRAQRGRAVAADPLLPFTNAAPETSSAAPPGDAGAAPGASSPGSGPPAGPTDAAGAPSAESGA